jgi:hypothetical protein
LTKVCVSVIMACSIDPYITHPILGKQHLKECRMKNFILLSTVLSIIGFTNNISEAQTINQNNPPKIIEYNNNKHHILLLVDMAEEDTYYTLHVLELIKKEILWASNNRAQDFAERMHCTENENECQNYRAYRLFKELFPFDRNCDYREMELTKNNKYVCTINGSYIILSEKGYHVEAQSNMRGGGYTKISNINDTEIKKEISKYSDDIIAHTGYYHNGLRCGDWYFWQGSDQTNGKIPFNKQELKKNPYAEKKDESCIEVKKGHMHCGPCES